MPQPRQDTHRTGLNNPPPTPFPHMPPRWYDRAACRHTDGDSFYPEKGGSTAPAKRVCAVCPVRDECLAYALENREPFGIWGMTSERERRQLLKGAW